MSDVKIRPENFDLNVFVETGMKKSKENKVTFN